MSDKTLFVYSTLSNDNRYLNHAPGGADLKEPIGDGVLIKGGANIPDGRLETPFGVVTRISEDELAYLNENYLFGLHQKNGFITVRKDKVEAEVAAANMQGADGSAPMTPNDLGPDDPKPISADGKSADDDKPADDAGRRPNSRRA